MRILYLHPGSWSGEPVMLRVFRDLGHEVSVLEERRGLGRARELRPAFAEAGDGIATLFYDPGRGAEKALTWPADRFFKRDFDGRNLAHRMWIERAALRRFEPDVVFCGDGFSYAIPAALLKRAGVLRVPLMVSYIGGDVLDCPEAEVGKRRVGLTSWLIRTSVRVPELLRPVSPMVRDVLIAEGADLSRIRLIPTQLVREPDELAPLRDDRAAIGRQLRARYGIEAGAPIVATLGGNQRGKALEVLAAAWPQVHAAFPRCRWLLCGPQHPWLEQAVWPVLDAAGLRKSVVPTGRLDAQSVFEHLAAADLHVNPSLCESLNMATVEAAAVGTPTVSSDGAGISDWLSRLGCGAVVRRGEVDALAEAIIRALGSAQLREQWSEACRTLVPEFSPRRVGTQLVECMAAAVDSTSRGVPR